MFELSRSYKLVAKVNKYIFYSDSVEFWRHIISKAGVATNPRKIQAIVNQLSKTIKQLRGFLKLTSYYREYVKGNGSICRPLTRLLKKYGLGWNEEATTAFELPKEVMTIPHALVLPDLNKLFMVEIDALSMGIMAIMVQEGHPIDFINKPLGPK